MEKNEAQILASCRRLHQRSEQEFADRGIWILYVGLGMLNWIAPEDQRPVASPLKLVPVRLERTGTRFRLRRTGDEAVVNSSPALKMSRDFGIALPEFEDPDFTAEELTGQVREAVAGESGWSVDPRSILMSFTFHKEAMYQDLVGNEEQVMASSLIQAMVLGPAASRAGQEPLRPRSSTRRFVSSCATPWDRPRTRSWPRFAPCFRGSAAAPTSRPP